MDIDEYVQKVVDEAPPLRDDQKARLRELMNVSPKVETAA